MDLKNSFIELFFLTFLLCLDHGLSIVPDEDYFDEPSFNRCPWIRNKLKNGRVRYRYKGRVAKFLCDSGFELAGKRSATCVRGQWSNPVPVCVARGCPRVPYFPNGRITEMYRGALLVYDCNPGYVLNGYPTIHCDGRRWNASPPFCSIAIENPETYCDFEKPDLCGWSHDQNHDFDWQRNQFSTPSGHVGTGPAFDHTFGENKGGFYLYIEASSPRKVNDTARLFSPVYSQDLSGGCFVFWYHMYGSTTGGLRIYLKPESHVFDELKPNWEKYGDQGNQWLKGYMIVPVLHENFQIVIEGLRGESYIGDSAIDDVRLSSNLCDSEDNSTDTTESVDEYSCRGRCQETGSSSACGCNANCVYETNFCCRDYYTICTTGNSTAVQSTDEPLPEDFETSTSTAAQSTAFTVDLSKVSSTITEQNLSTEREESSHSTQFTGSSTSTLASVSTYTDNFTEKHIPLTTAHHLETISTETETSAKTIVIPYTVPSTAIKPEESTVSTVVKTAQYSQYVSQPISETSKYVTTTPPTTSVQTTTITSTTDQTTPTTIQMTTPTGILTTKLTTNPTTTVKTTQSTPETITTTSSTLSTTLETTTKIAPTTVYENNVTTNITGILTPETQFYTSSISATTSSNTEPTSMSTTTISSTRKTYNLRPRNRTTTTESYQSDTTTTVQNLPFSNTTKFTLVTSTPFSERSREYSITTKSGYLTSWYRNYVSTSTRKKSESTSLETTTETFTSGRTTENRYMLDTTTENVPETTKFPNRFTKPTKKMLPKSSDSYESKAETTSSNSSVPIVVSIVIILIICLIVGFTYYVRKQRSKRQSKLSDDSEMRFLPESDYMEYSDASALDRILVK